MGDTWPLPIDNSPRWTPRRALMMTGTIFLVTGILGFFVDWRADNPVYLDIEKQAILIVLGCLMWYVGEVWDSQWKRWVAGPLSIAFFVLGAATLLAGDLDFGFTQLNAPFEGGFLLVVGAWHAICVWYPRQFHDYEWATGVSSGLPDR